MNAHYFDNTLDNLNIQYNKKFKKIWTNVDLSKTIIVISNNS